MSQQKTLYLLFAAYLLSNIGCIGALYYASVHQHPAAVAFFLIAALGFAAWYPLFLYCLEHNLLKLAIVPGLFFFLPPCATLRQMGIRAAVHFSPPHQGVARYFRFLRLNHFIEGVGNLLRHSAGADGPHAKQRMFEARIMLACYWIAISLLVIYGDMLLILAIALPLLAAQILAHKIFPQR